MSYFMESDRIRFGFWSNEIRSLGVELWSDSDVTSFIGGPFSEEQIQSKLDSEIHNKILYGIQYWPIFLKAGNEFVGCCGLRPRGEAGTLCELGFHLRSAYWGKGLAKEAANRVIKYAFTDLKLQSVFAGHNPMNVASKQLLENLGFQFTHEEFYEPTGLNHPSYILHRNHRFYMRH